MSILPAISSRRLLSFSRISCIDWTRLRSLDSFRDVEDCTKMLVFVVEVRTCVFVLPVNSTLFVVIIVVVDIDEDGERASTHVFRLADTGGGENCEFESMSELVHGTELGCFSFDKTDAGC